MSITGGIIIYVNLWMIIFFMVLPFGITNQIDSPDYQKGTDPGDNKTPSTVRAKA